MYSALVLLDAETSIGIESVLSTAKTAFPSKDGVPVLSLVQDTLAIKWPSFELKATFSNEGHVLDESKDLSALVKESRLSEKIARCSARFEIESSTDSEMNYFNDFCILVEVIERLGVVYCFDSSAGEFMNLPIPTTAQKPWWRFW